MIKSSELKATNLSSIERPATTAIPITYLLRKRLFIVEFETIILSYDFPSETGWRSSKMPPDCGAREILMAYVINDITNIKSVRTISFNSLTLSERGIISIKLTINQCPEIALTKSLLAIHLPHLNMKCDN